MEHKNIRTALASLIGILAFGTIAYHTVEQMSLFDAFYMTVISITTVGFGEIRPLSEMGRVITMVVIGLGISVGTYSLSMLFRMLVEGELRKTLGRKKVKKQIAGLNNHYIICGFGRVGSLICSDLRADKIDFVVIEQDLALVEKMEDQKMLFLQMDATNEDALLAAGIMQARGLVTAVKSDADNVFITLTAKGLRPDIFILARSSDVKNEAKLIRAGATRVVSPYLIGGRRMAQVLKRPTVVDFIDIAMMDSHLGLMMEETRVNPGSYLVGKNLIESNLRKDYGLIIVAIKKSSGEMIFNPMPAEVLEDNDIIVVIGKRQDLLRMNQRL